MYHKAVLLKESVEGLNIKPNGIYVDVTFGAGGHSRAILNQLGPKGQLFAFDQDKDALINAIDDNRFVLINQNFKHMTRFLRFYGVSAVDGILADLGVSSHQFDKAERGFSIRFDADLDMRMNQELVLSADQVVNEYEETELSRVLFQYGDLRQSRAMAKEIVSQRTKAPIKTINQLKIALKKFLNHRKENKILAQVFQAIRIEVNQEIEVLKSFLSQVPDLLKDKGRLSTISYHSIEDRLVKRFIRSGLFEGEPERDLFGNYEVPLKKVGNLITPTNKEIEQNNRARSAKLRIAEKIS